MRLRAKRLRAELMFETLPAALAERARQTPHEPWLFYRRGWDWQWYSWRQVADLVARGAENAQLGETELFAPPPLTPDAVATTLAIQTAGATASPKATNLLEMPSFRTHLERYEPQIPESRAQANDDAFPGVTHAQLAAAAAEISADLSALAPAKNRDILAFSPSLAAARHGEIHREWLAWCLASGAAWALEDEPEAFLVAALWARPTLIVATGRELDVLGNDLKQRKYRRWHRLRAVLAVDSESISTTWDTLGIAALRLKR